MILSEAFRGHKDRMKVNKFIQLTKPSQVCPSVSRTSRTPLIINYLRQTQHKDVNLAPAFPITH